MKFLKNGKPENINPQIAVFIATAFIIFSLFFKLQMGADERGYLFAGLVYLKNGEYTSLRYHPFPSILSSAVFSLGFSGLNTLRVVSLVSFLIIFFCFGSIFKSFFSLKQPYVVSSIICTTPALIVLPAYSGNSLVSLALALLGMISVGLGIKTKFSNKKFAFYSGFVFGLGYCTR